jgi:hypothetical protein
MGDTRACTGKLRFAVRARTPPIRARAQCVTVRARMSPVRARMYSSDISARTKRCVRQSHLGATRARTGKVFASVRAQCKIISSVRAQA